MKKLFLVCLALFYTSILEAQDKNGATALSGVVVDAQTLAPLPFTHISKNYKQGMVTDENGRFTIEAAPGDTIEITYVGYHNQTLSHHEKQEKFVVVAMKRSLSLLQEVEVHFIPGQKELKEIFLNPIRHLIYAQNNILLIQLYAYTISEPEHDHFFNHTNIGEPSEFSLFSSRNQRGFTRFIKTTQIINGQSTYFNLKPYKQINKELLEEVSLANPPASANSPISDAPITRKTLK